MRRESRMEKQRKILTRVQLINWHYFENEIMSMHGSTLISGENTAGKSTILDAIQLVLTTNTRKFNVAANEKGNRDLKGYVRCKIGNVGETYLRKNTVPANVALEFYEEKTDRYFVIGVHMLSVDEESPVITKWYCEECRLERLSFMTGNRASLADEFRNNGKKIRYIDQKNAAKDRFKRRMGNLDDKFFDIIPKSLAFKPMDNVKDFINKFVLSEEKIDVASLRENIETLSELEALLVRSQKQLQLLEQIINKRDAIDEKDRDIKINELLIAMAEQEKSEIYIEKKAKSIRMSTLSIESNINQIQQMDKMIADFEQQIIDLNVMINSNQSNKLVEEVKRRLHALESEQTKYQEDEKKFNHQIALLKKYCIALKKLSYHMITLDELWKLQTPIMQSEKSQVIEKIESFQRNELREIQSKDAENRFAMEQLSKEIEELQEKQRSLEKQRLIYPEQPSNLKYAIEKEFQKRQIDSKVYYLAELLEVSDARWQNAVEGYLGMQKFYLIVEPEYYLIALEVYNRQRKHIHSAGIINTRKLPRLSECDNQSLAYVIESDNRYAKSYANYILGRAIRCEDVKEFENYDIAISPECMLYQGYVVRHINPRNYRNPYIGQNAYRTQLVNVKTKLVEKSQDRAKLRETNILYTDILEKEGEVSLDLIRLYAEVPYRLEKNKEAVKAAKLELKEASNDPTLIELNIKLDEKRKECHQMKVDNQALRDENTNLRGRIEQMEQESSEAKEQLRTTTNLLGTEEDRDGLAFKDAREKYQQNRKSKKPAKIVENFSPQRSQFTNERNNLLNGQDGLVGLQYRYNQEFTQDFLVGLEGMAEYRQAYQKLKTIEMIRYEERLKSAKENCEEIFKSDFLSKMKEHIETARNEFKSLNKALNQIYYGDDSYRFKISFDKKKEGLYRMITSENNQAGNNLWTSAFEAEYQEEMKELFDKLMTKDDKGQKIVEEYTDYRSYLDYDIEIHKKDGSMQRFSDIYGEKSGSETQVPYYVAIAASFYQLYRYGNSVRLMLLDEAFDKMDDERIASMMEFFSGLGLQVLLATPPAKIEVIGEKVGTVLAAIRVGQNSIVEEYDL